MEVTAGRKHDAFNASHFGRPRKLKKTFMGFKNEKCTGKEYLHAGSISFERVDDGHVCEENEKVR